MSVSDSHNEPDALTRSAWQSSSIEVLVDRQEQIDKFNNVLNRVSRRRPVSSALFEWCGGPGIGKTQLIRLLEQSCQTLRVPYVCISFNESLTGRFAADPTELVELMVLKLLKPPSSMLDSLLERIKSFRSIELPGKVVPSYYQLTREQRLYERPEWLDHLREVSNDFIGLVNSLAHSESAEHMLPAVIFFDETEYADPELVDWIEEWVISPLAQTKHCVIVWTARRPWRWKRPETRRRIQSEQLPLFRPVDAKAQMQTRSSGHDLVKTLFRKVYAVTNGHPSANAVAVTHMNIWADSQGIHEQLPPYPERELVKEIYNEFIIKYAFRRLDADEQIACELMAMVRLFDTVMLREVLQASGGRQFEHWSHEDFGELLLRLKRTQLLTWKKGYTIDSDLRHIIRRYFLFGEREMFTTVNQVASEVYRHWLSRPVNNRNLFVMEELYHQASLLQVGESVEELNEVLQKHLAQYPGWIVDKPAMRLALEQLQGELKYDAELSELTDGQSSTEMVGQIQDFCDTFDDDKISL